MENQIRFYGRGGEFFGIWIVNILLSVVTLGIYSAWAKVRTKKYFYGNTDLAGDRFDYHGDPVQILKGRIVAIVCVWIWLFSSKLSPTVTGILFVLFMAIMPWLVYSNTRFDARMTSYRNVRFNFVGTLKDAYIVFLGGPIAAFAVISVCATLSRVISGFSSIVGGLLGLGVAALAFVAYAWVGMRISSYFANGYCYGHRRFNAVLMTKEYVKTYLLAGLLGGGISLLMVLVISLVVGISSLPLLATDPTAVGIAAMMFAGFFIYIGMFVAMLVVSGFVHARIRNYVFSQISTDGEPPYGLGSRMTAGSLVWLHLTNFFLAVITLGFARPWVMVRSARYVADTTAVYGDMSQLTAHGEDYSDDSALGDEMANAFDLDIGIG
ncbi:DUF898 domain-containing protein [Photobacterium japonica]|uniref:YjgN family protein n=1 Tax=Photobacterium japonica TaxID=2910235 RepID=UPI003D0D909B